MVASGPDVPGDPLYEGIVSMIQEAEKSIWIVTPYFIPDDVLLRSLIVKARAGRNVTLVVPAHSNHRIADLARRQYLGELRRAGGRLLLYAPGMLHAKAIIVDDQIALFGSPNFDVRSLFVNFEVGVLAHSAADVAAISAWAGSLTGQCVEPRAEPSPRRKIFGNVAEDISRLLAPLLWSVNMYSDGVPESLPARIDDVVAHADRAPDRLAVAALDEHPCSGAGALAAVEDAHLVVAQRHAAELG